MKPVVVIFLKALFLFLLLIGGYYFFSKVQIAKERVLTIHYSNLVQNKISYLNLAKLNPKDPSFDMQKSNLVGIIKETNKRGLEKPLSDKEKEIFERQNKILEKVFATKSYEEGVTILKSPESVKLLVDQTELIQDLAREREKLKALPLLR